MKISPSKVPRLMLCMGSVNQCEGIAETKTAPQERGNKLHALMTLALNLGDLSALDGQNLDKTEQQSLGWCFQEASRMGLDFPNMRTLLDHPLKLEFLGFEKKGDRDNEWQLDFARVNNQIGFLTDFKFGSVPVPKAANNWQLKTYALGLAREFGLREIHAKILQPSSWKENAELVIWKTADFDEFESQIKDAVEMGSDIEAPLVPGVEQCQFCPAKGTCTAFAGFKQSVANHKAEVVTQEIAAAMVGTAITVKPLGEILNERVVISAELVKQAEDLLAEADNLATRITLGESPTDDADAGNLRDRITSLMKIIEANRVQVKKPVIEYERQIDGAAGTALNPLGAGKEKINGALKIIWQRGQDKKAKEEAAAREAEEKRQKELDDAAALAASAKTKKEKEAAAAKLAEVQEKQAEQVAQAKEAEQTTAVTTPKTYTTKTRKIFKLRVDVKKIPPEFRMVVANDVLIQAAVDSGQLKTCAWVTVEDEPIFSAKGKRK